MWVWYIQISLSTLLLLLLLLFRCSSVSSSNYYAEHESYYFNLILSLWRLLELLDCAITFLSNKPGNSTGADWKRYFLP